MRSGTDNVPGIAGLAKSAEIVYRHFDEQTAQMRACKHRLIEGLRELDDVVIHGMPEEEGAPQIVNASFLNVRSEVLLHAGGPPDLRFRRKRLLITQESRKPDADCHRRIESRDGVCRAVQLQRIYDTGTD